MHEEHPVFEPPKNPDVPIWRYMDLVKFVSILSARALHFARVDVMEDVFEGSIGNATLRERRNWLVGDDMLDDTFRRFQLAMVGRNEAASS